MIKLKGIAWDHPRGYDPLIAASREFKISYPDVDIKWDLRSLKEFGDMPIELLIEKYDLITIDHPYIGQADKNGLLLKLGEYSSDEVLETLRLQSVGSCFDSYSYNGHMYALPIDAAALLAAYRKDMLAETSLVLPKTREELKTLYGKISSDFSIAWALCPTDFWCTFLTLCAQDGGQGFIIEGVVDKNIGSRVLDEIKFHLEYLHPESMSWNPIQILDRMGTDDEIIYSPYLFGYSNYARKGYAKKVVHFTNSPVNPNHDISTILGGVGLAVSSKCQQPALATKFVEYVASAEIQQGIYTQNSGQPGNMEAWKSKTNNALCNSFFEDTLVTLENAYVRPQHPGWNKFQEQGAYLLHDGTQKNIESDRIVNELNQLYQTILHDEKV